MIATPHAQIANALRESVVAARQRMSRLEGGAGGVEVCAELSDAYDEIVGGLWHDLVADQAGAGRMALVATGGWGRREVCPYSDIDFILLCHKRDADRARELADKLLYPMWDARIDVGHAVRDPQATAKLAKDDLATATALLDVRLVAGNPDLVDQLQRATRKVIAPGGNANGFVAKLAREKESRHDRFGDSLYLLEPNLKQGIGALRDLATSVWAARARWSITELSELVSLGHATSRQVAILEAARDFLLRIRALLQLSAGRATDQLTFEIQEAIAPSLYPEARPPSGDVRPAVAPAVEALMRHYYLHARGVVQVADRLLEAATVPARRRPRIRRVDRSFLTFNGKLSLRDPAVVSREPAEMVRLFRVACEHQLPVYGHTKELIAQTVADRHSALTGNAVAGGHFLDALIDPTDSGQPAHLEEMHQLGLLSALMPEFAPCTCRVQHDLYHVYTVDQHQLYAVAMLKRLARGELTDAYPTATAALATVTRPVPLYLSTLLHDVGKPMGKGHAEKGARIAGIIARRFRLAEGDVELCEFLVRQHLTMSHLSQRRDLSDPEVIERFASRVGDEERLVQLYLLTLVDTAMTAPGNLNQWKEQLLRELFVRTRDYLRGNGPTVEVVADQRPRVRERTLELLIRRGFDEAVAKRWLDSVDERFFDTLTPRQAARHLALAIEREASGAPVAISVACYPLKGHSELAVVADDVRGLLSAIAGVLSANRVDVLGAMVGCKTGDDGAVPPVALDMFHVRDLVGRAIAEDDPRWDRIRDDLAAIVGGGVDPEQIRELMQRRRKRSMFEERVTPEVPTVVTIHNEASTDYTVVEVATRDGVGVLHAITRALTDMGLDIHLARVATEGERVADAFYVAEGDGSGKVANRTRLRAIEDNLVRALTAS